MTAVTLARLFVGSDNKVLGVVAVCGVPGSGSPLPQHVLCSIFRSTLHRYWIANGREIIYALWKTSLYNVDFDGFSQDPYAWVVNATCMGKMLRCIEAAHGIDILQ